MHFLKIAPFVAALAAVVNAQVGQVFCHEDPIVDAGDAHAAVQVMCIFVTYF